MQKIKAGGKQINFLSHCSIDVAMCIFYFLVLANLTYLKMIIVNIHTIHVLFLMNLNISFSGMKLQ